MYSYGPPTYARGKAGRPARTYMQQLCEETGCSSEDLPEAMNDREKWRERVKDIRTSATTWWWWYMYKPDLALNNLHWFICHKTKPNQTKSNLLFLTCVVCFCYPSVVRPCESSLISFSFGLFSELFSGSF